MYPQGTRILVCNYKLELYLKKVLVPKSRVILKCSTENYLLDK